MSELSDLLQSAQVLRDELDKFLAANPCEAEPEEKRTAEEERAEAALRKALVDIRPYLSIDPTIDKEDWDEVKGIIRTAIQAPQSKPDGGREWTCQNDSVFHGQEVESCKSNSGEWAFGYGTE